MCAETFYIPLEIMDDIDKTAKFQLLVYKLFIY